MALFLLCAPAAWAQQDPPPAPSATTQPVTESQTPSELEHDFFRNYLRDQKHIWTSPLRLRGQDAKWLAPAGILLGETLHRDAYMAERIHFNGTGKASRTFSDAGVAALGGTLGAAYLFGRISKNDHARETGILGAQAVLNTLTVNYALKYTLGRERPFEGAGRGPFFSGSESFPSSHAAMAWSMASVLAHEYPGPLTKIAVYGLATAVSFSRVTGRRHFPADAIVGSAIGWAIGRSTYRRHHDFDLPGAPRKKERKPLDPRSLASVYVPLDHWAYPALDRLAGMGYLSSAYADLRPWTRMECARLVLEAGSQIEQHDRPSKLAVELHAALRKEFAREIALARGEQEQTAEFRVDSLYTRLNSIAGTPLNDSYHLGQTIVNDDGRPYQSGISSYSGITASATSGRWAASLQAEYQHAGSAPAKSLALRQEIAAIDFLPAPEPATPVAQTDRVRLLDTYGTVAFRNWQLSFGNQSLYWGPSESGALNFSNNAEPIPMLRLDRVSPMQLPGFLHIFGPIRGEVFLGTLRGQKYFRTVRGFFTAPYDAPVLVHGGKFTVKPTPNLEVGVSVTTVFGGPGIPFTLRSFFRSFSVNNALPGALDDPGDRRTGFDFKYRLPLVRRYLTVYNDSMAEDELSPSVYPRRSAMAPGLFLSHLPRAERFDLRMEGFYTDLPGLRQKGVYYANNRFLSGFTNYGNILGHWIGRQGYGWQTQARYWISPFKVLEFTYRNSRVSPQFIQNGGSQASGKIGARWRIKGGLDLQGYVQYERWLFPILSPRAQENVTTSFQVTYWPKRDKAKP